MIKNYFKIAWRNIMKHKVFSLINVIGLTIGLSASFVIGLMIYYDYTFDDFHKDGDRIYRVVSDFKTPQGKFHNSGVTLALKDAIADNLNFENITEFYINRPSKVENKAKNTEFKWPNFVMYTDEAYFNIFDYKFIAGDKSTALDKPNNVILTETRAKEYFPNTAPADIIGKTLVYNDSINITVSGVVENFKNRTDFVFKEFVSHQTLLQTDRRGELLERKWSNTNSDSQLFVKLTESANVASIQKRLDDLALEHTDEDDKKYEMSRKFQLQPLSDIHFNEDYGIYDWSKGQASKSLLSNLALVALFLLLLGCINFINLNTAQASQRAKEIGIRKTLGSSRKQLIGQFMGETFLLVFFSALLSIALSKWLINVFSDFVPEDLSFELFKAPLIVLSILLLLLVVTILSGFYPALVLSKFNTVSVLKNHMAAGEKKVRLRKFLTVFQFTIAQVFIIGTLLVGKQINYLLNKDMGFKTDAIVSVYSPRSESELSKKELYAEKLRAIPEIKSVSLGSHAPASYSTNTTNITYTDEEEIIKSEMQYLFGDTKYANLFELDLLAGRVHRNDTVRELVINETLLKKLGFNSPQDAIGKTLTVNDEQTPIVGVMADFNQRSLKSEIKPMALRGDWYRPQFSQFQAVHVSFHNESPENLKSTLIKIEDAYKSIYTETEDYRVQFMDETIATFYNREKKISKLLNWATGLSILISCLGLLGLVIYTTNRRVKEIGVRKVLGASLLQINTLLCKEFLILVAIAFVIATPLAWYGIYSWLQDFTYKISISFIAFIVGGVAMIFFALLVISIKTLQAANSNPVNSLRSE
ncbi:ABC transporter permease [Winogradskyella jejuensis]|uniref:ABC-type antimicrobial peptide transport system, permease component n=1 Tax=Winogradskyella jejuensis TaxID=1089305 RepID=A0A1M5KKC7_9FLAO|nr:ABC transporter permease [Winogradskyella jejuensis]SHG52929.1 ABC-type antimicrobial peptide transport system, permease component [Winogradskyella jejuensis]